MFAVTFESRAFTAFRVVASLPFKSNSLTLTKEKEKKSCRTKRREGSEKKKKKIHEIPVTLRTKTINYTENETSNLSHVASTTALTFAQTT